jgi:hypothetical protein
MEDAPFCSKLLFHWVTPLMEKGAKKKLENSEDLYDLPLNLTPAYLCSQLEMAMALPSVSRNCPESGQCIYLIQVDFFQCCDSYSSNSKIHIITDNVKIQVIDCEKSCAI